MFSVLQKLNFRQREELRKLLNPFLYLPLEILASIVGYLPWLDDLFHLQISCKDCFDIFTHPDCFRAFSNQMQSFNVFQRQLLKNDIAGELKELYTNDLTTKLFTNESVYFPNKIRHWTAIDSFLVAVDSHNLLNVFDPTTASIHAVEVGSVSALNSYKNRIILAKHSCEIQIWQFHGELFLLKTLSIAHVNCIRGLVAVDSFIYSCGLDGSIICYDLEMDRIKCSYSDKFAKFIALYFNGFNVFVLSKAGKILKFTANLEFVDEHKFQSVIATSAYNKLIAVSTSDSIIILDTNLKVLHTRRICNVTSIALNERFLAFNCGEVTLMFTIQEFMRDESPKPGKLFLKSQIKFLNDNWYWAHSSYISLMT